MSKTPKFSNWKDAWEWHARQTKNEYAKQSEAARQAAIDELEQLIQNQLASSEQ